MLKFLGQCAGHLPDPDIVMGNPTAHCTTQHHFTLNYTTSLHTALHNTTSHCTTQHHFILHYTTPLHTALHNTTSHCTTQQHCTLHYTTPLHISHCTLHCTTLSPKTPHTSQNPLMRGTTSLHCADYTTQTYSAGHIAHYRTIPALCTVCNRVKSAAKRRLDESVKVSARSSPGPRLLDLLSCLVRTRGVLIGEFTAFGYLWSLKI